MKKHFKLEFVLVIITLGNLFQLIAQAAKCLPLHGRRTTVLNDCTNHLPSTVNVSLVPTEAMYVSNRKRKIMFMYTVVCPLLL